VNRSTSKNNDFTDSRQTGRRPHAPVKSQKRQKFQREKGEKTATRRIARKSVSKRSATRPFALLAKPPPTVDKKSRDPTSFPVEPRDR